MKRIGGQLAQSLLSELNVSIATEHYRIVKDEQDLIQNNYKNG